MHILFYLPFTLGDLQFRFLVHSIAAAIHAAAGNAPVVRVSCKTIVVYRYKVIVTILYTATDFIYFFYHFIELQQCRR